MRVRGVASGLGAETNEEKSIEGIKDLTSWCIRESNINEVFLYLHKASTFPRNFKNSEQSLNFYIYKLI